MRVVPARAGMSPATARTVSHRSRGPRPRGDEPGTQYMRCVLAQWSPPARG